MINLKIIFSKDFFSNLSAILMDFKLFEYENELFKKQLGVK